MKGSPSSGSTAEPATTRSGCRRSRAPRWSSSAARTGGVTRRPSSRAWRTPSLASASSQQACAGSRTEVTAVGAAKKLVRVLPDALQRFFADQCPQQAAAIAYRVLFSIAPLAIILVSIFGLLLEDDSLREDVVDAIVDALPVTVAGRQDVENAITAIATPASAAGLVSLVVFAWAATGMMTAVRRGLENAMGVTESRPMARGKLVDLALIVGAAVLVLVSVGITLLGNLLQKASGSLSGLTGSVLLHGATFLLSIVVVLLLYRFVPARGIRIHDGLAGAILTAILLLLISLASSWIYNKTTQLSVV